MSTLKGCRAHRDVLAQQERPPRILRHPRAAAILAACVLGCAAAPRSFTPRCDANDVLVYAERLEEWPAPELEKEYQAVRSSFARTQGSCDRLRLVFLLLWPGTRFHDEARALKLLTEFLESRPGSASGLRPLAHLTASALQRQWELENRGKELTRKLGEEKTRADVLKRQLDELKEIERILNERQKK